MTGTMLRLRYRNGNPPEPHRWRIHFRLAEAPSGDATLTLAIASADCARIRVFVNDEDRPLAELTPAVQGGNALLREAIHAKYCVEYVPIPAGRLKVGENTISLALASVQAAGGACDVRLLESRTAMKLHIARRTALPNLVVIAATLAALPHASAVEPTPPARDALATLFLIGDSTVNNSTKGLQGWGTPIAKLFDPAKIHVENKARGGRSSRS